MNGTIRVIKGENCMKMQIRQSVFETNSSSVHSITMCTENEFDEWRNGKIYRNNGWWGSSTSTLKQKCFLTQDEAIELIKSSNWYEPMNEYEDIDSYFREYDIHSYENWGDYYETDVTHYTTPNGEKIVAICYYGHD
jgi:hypothetical protein